MDQPVNKDIPNPSNIPTPNVEGTTQVPATPGPVEIIPPEEPKKNSIVFMVGFVVVAVIAIAGYFVFQSLQPKAPEQPLIQEPVVIDESGNALISYIPNFDKLKVEDLPNFIDFRSIYEYKDNLIVFGYKHVMEYDPKTKEIVRVNNTAMLECGDSSAKIDNFLFIGCNTPEAFKDRGPASKLYKIDLSTGKIVKEYFGEDSDLTSRKVNIRLQSQGTTLWIATWDGVIKMDTTTDVMTTHTPDQLFKKDCRPSSIFDNKGNISVLTTEGADCGGGVTVYKPDTDTWEYKDVDIRNYLETETTHYTDLGPYIKEKWLNFTVTPNFELPTYFTFTSKIKNKYYILASDGLYTLEDKEFPKRIIDQKIAFGSFINKPAVSANERYLVFISPTGEGPRLNTPKVNELLAAYLVDLQTNELVNLMEDQTFDQEITTHQEESINKIQELTASEADGIMIFKDKEGVEIMTVDLAVGKLHIK